MKKQDRDRVELSYTDGNVINEDTGEPMSVILFNKQFMDEFNRVIKVELLMKKRDGQNVQISNQKYKNSYLQKVGLTLNKYGLYYHYENDNSLNGLQDMIRLDEMISNDEVR